MPALPPVDTANGHSHSNGTSNGDGTSNGNGKENDATNGTQPP
jgi:hypothetical protein